MSNKLTFEEGKHYRTRDGQKMLLVCIRQGYMVCETPEGKCRVYTRDGMYLPTPGCLDLVAEWREPRKWNVLIWQTLDGTASTVSFENVEYEGAEWELAAKGELVEGQGME